MAGSEKLNYIPQEKAPFENCTNSLKFNSSPATKKEKISISPNLVRTITQDRFKESQHINKSLFFLTSVISLISQGKKYFKMLIYEKSNQHFKGNSYTIS